MLEQFEGNHNDFSQQQGFSSPADQRLLVRFFRKAAQDMEKTQSEGRAIFIEVEYIQIMIPGDRDSVVVRPATHVDKARFAKQYENWKSNTAKEVVSGTPLEAWGILSLAQVEELRYYGLRTVEHIAELRDDVAQKVMGAAILKQKAQLFVQASKEAAPMLKMQEELAKRDNELDSLRAALKEQGDALAALQAKAGPVKQK
jgi:hypothetical protein